MKKIKIKKEEAVDLGEFLEGNGIEVELVQCGTYTERQYYCQLTPDLLTRGSDKFYKEEFGELPRELPRTSFNDKLRHYGKSTMDVGAVNKLVELLNYQERDSVSKILPSKKCPCIKLPFIFLESTPEFE